MLFYNVKKLAALGYVILLVLLLDVFNKQIPLLERLFF